MRSPAHRAASSCNGSQEREYTDGQLTLVILDGRDTKHHEVVASAEAQEELVGALTLYLGEPREERLHLISARRTTLTVSYSSGDTTEPATELVVGIQRAEEGEKEPELLLQVLSEAHETGQLSELLGVSRDKVRISARPPLVITSIIVVTTRIDDIIPSW